MRRVPLPSEGLYPLRSIAFVGLIYGAATVAQGSGFLAVSSRASSSATRERRTSARSSASTPPLASLGEIVAFTVLGSP